MVGGDAIRAKFGGEAFRKCEGDLFHQPARVDEDQRGAVRQGEGGEPVEDLLPHGGGGDGAEFVGGNLDGEVELAALADLDDGALPTPASKFARRGPRLRAVLDGVASHPSRAWMGHPALYIPPIASARWMGHPSRCGWFIPLPG